MPFIFKLYTNWEEEANKKVTYYKNRKRHYTTKMPKKQIKEIYKLIAKSEVIKVTDEYVEYKYEE